VTDTNDLTAKRAQETVYQDSSGRRRKRRRWNGEKALFRKTRQRKEDKNWRNNEARRADDKDLNEELKAKELWNDPAACIFDGNNFLCLTTLFRKRDRKGLGSLNTMVLQRIGLVSNPVIGGMVSRLVYILCSIQFESLLRKEIIFQSKREQKAIGVWTSSRRFLFILF
jgi:hypothetical protein